MLYSWLILLVLVIELIKSFFAYFTYILIDSVATLTCLSELVAR